MWQGIYGHDAVVEQFRRALASGRLATTYLFIGPEGVGKRSLALKLAQGLLCQSNGAAGIDPCGTCESCVLAAAGNHPDVYQVATEPGKKQLGLKPFVGEKEMRNREGLCHDIALRPMLGGRKVAVIDDADWLTNEAANCMLKTLEEPPPGAVIFMLGTSRGRQLPTILSRSQIVRFDPLPAEEMSQVLLERELVPDAAAAERFARQSDGTVTSALEQADAELWQMRDRFAAQWNADLVDAARLVREIDEFASAAGKESEARRSRLRQLFRLAYATFRQSLRAAADDARAEVALAALDRTLEAEEQLDRNANLATLIECWIDDLVSLRWQAAA
jgi:DNA polymerase-3 subunit delta'